MKHLNNDIRSYVYITSTNAACSRARAPSTTTSWCLLYSHKSERDVHYHASINGLLSFPCQFLLATFGVQASQPSGKAMHHYRACAKMLSQFWSSSSILISVEWFGFVWIGCKWYEIIWRCIRVFRDVWPSYWHSPRVPASRSNSISTCWACIKWMQQ